MRAIQSAARWPRARISRIRPRACSSSPLRRTNRLITRRAWTDESGRPCHQIIDPASGDPAYTGVLQVTAVAPTGLLAETLAKSALLSGPGSAEAWLPYGGVIVDADGPARVVEPLTRVLPEVWAA